AGCTAQNGNWYGVYRRDARPCVSTIYPVPANLPTTHTCRGHMHQWNAFSFNAIPPNHADLTGF
ncbi:MAG: hypothetical protein R6V52_00090, partial [Bacteroidales bacterium]